MGYVKNLYCFASSLHSNKCENMSERAQNYLQSLLVFEWSNMVLSGLSSINLLKNC